MAGARASRARSSAGRPAGSLDRRGRRGHRQPGRPGCGDRRRGPHGGGHPCRRRRRHRGSPRRRRRDDDVDGHGRSGLHRRPRGAPVGRIGPRRRGPRRPVHGFRSFVARRRPSSKLSSPISPADLAGVDGVVHLAALKYAGVSVEEPLRFYRNNVDGMRPARRHGRGRVWPSCTRRRARSTARHATSTWSSPRRSGPRAPTGRRS